MKKILLAILLIATLVPATVGATPVTWDFTSNILQPLRSMWSSEVKVPYITATSTSATSTLPWLEATRFRIGSDFITDITGDNLSITNGVLNVTGGGTISTSSPLVAGESVYATGVDTIASVATGTLSENITGLEFDASRYLIGGSAVLSLSSGYSMFLTASGTEWSSFYITPSTRITAGTGIDWSGNTLNGVYTAGDGLTLTSEDFDCDTASASVFGCLTSTDWSAFNNKVSSTSLSATYPLNYNSATGAFTFTGLATTSTWSPSNIAYVVNDNTLASVATGTLSASSPLALSSGSRFLIGGSDTLSIADAVANGSTKGAASFTANDFDSTSGNISLDYTNGQKATASLSGFLSSTDWATFNNKISSTSIDTESELETYLTDVADVVTTNTDDITSSELATLVNGDTGTGNLVFATLPTLAGFISNSSSTALYLTTVLSTSTRATTTNFHTSGTFSGAGLTDCDTAATSKVLWDSTSSAFSCGTDQTGGGGGAAGGWATTTDNNPEIGEIVTYTSEDVLIGGTASNTAEFNFNPEAATFTLSSTTASGGQIDLGLTGIRFTDDSDGALTILGLGDGSDENIILNFDDVSDTLGITSGTSLNLFNFGSIGLWSTASSTLSNLRVSALRDSADSLGSASYILGTNGSVATWIATTSIPLGGDVTGTLSATVVGNDSHDHTSATVSGLDISADTNLTAGDGLTLTDDDLDCDTATASVFGCLASADWSVFNNKVSTTSIDTIAELETLTSADIVTVTADDITAAELLSIVNGDTGTGNLVFSASPTFTGTMLFTNASGTIASSTHLSADTSVNLFNGGPKTTANALCIQLTGHADLCDGSDGGGGGTPGGVDGEIQYNNGGSFGGGGGFVWDDVNGRLGIGTSSPMMKLSVVGDIFSQQPYNTGSTTPTLNPGSVDSSIFLWYPKKAAFRAGEWDVPITETDIGRYGSVSFGYDTTASGDSTFAQGWYSSSTDIGAVAFGFNNTASGAWSFVAGNGSSISSGNASFVAGGDHNIASGNDSFASGYYNTVTSQSGYVGGELSSTTGYAGIAIGSNNTAGGDYSMAFGRNVGATGVDSVVFGSGVDSSGDRMLNTIPRSIFFGNRSTIPTLVIRSGYGAGTLGTVGIGTTSPYALLSVHTIPTMAGTTTLFAIASSTASATTTLFSVSNTGSTTATNGFNISAGCYAVNNICLGGTGTVTSVDMTVPTGLTVSGNPITTSGTLALTLTSGYVIPLTASTTEWAKAFASSSVLSATSPLAYAPTTGVFSIQNAVSDGSTKGAASFTAADFNDSSGNISIDYTNGQEATASLDGFLSSGNWTLFNDKVSSTSIDTLAELETLQGSINIIQSTEIDTSSELAGILTDEWGTGRFVTASSSQLSSTTLWGNTLLMGSTTLQDATSTNLFSTTASSTNLFSSVFTFGSNILSLVTNTITAGAAAIIDFGGAVSFEIPNGTGNTVDTVGEIALDTTDDQLIVADSGGTARVFGHDEFRVISVTIASTSMYFNSGQSLAALSHKDGLEITQYRCYVQGGTSKVLNLTDGTNDTETITCGTTVTSDTDVATNDTFTADELGYIEFGATTGAVDTVHFEAYARITRE